MSTVAQGVFIKLPIHPDAVDQVITVYFYTAAVKTLWKLCSNQTPLVTLATIKLLLGVSLSGKHRGWRQLCGRSS